MRVMKGMKRFDDAETMSFGKEHSRVLVLCIRVRIVMTRSARITMTRLSTMLMRMTMLTMLTMLKTLTTVTTDTVLTVTCPKSEARRRSRAHLITSKQSLDDRPKTTTRSTSPKKRSMLRSDKSISECYAMQCSEN